MTKDEQLTYLDEGLHFQGANSRTADELNAVVVSLAEDAGMKFDAYDSEFLATLTNKDEWERGWLHSQAHSDVLTEMAGEATEWINEHMVQDGYCAEFNFDFGGWGVWECDDDES